MKKQTKNIKYFSLVGVLLLILVSFFTVLHAETESDMYVQPQRSITESQQSTLDQGSESRITDTTEDRAAADGTAGQILATHVCPIHGYQIIISRPAGFPENASERVIQVEKMNKSFNATWNEVSNLISNYMPSEIDYHQLPQNPGPAGERYCNRNGHMIPTDTNVWQVSLAHYNDYNGSTSIFGDSNIEVAPLIQVIDKYNQLRDQGDALPPTCNYGCLDGNDGGVSPTDPGGDFNFGEIDFGDTDPRKPWENNGVDGNTGGVDGEPGAGNENEGIDEADDIIVPAQDYNSSRSNRIKSEFFHPIDWDEEEDDFDGVVTVSRENIPNIQNISPEVRCGADKNVRDGNGGLYCWGSGVRAAASGDSNDDGTIATSTRILQFLSINGHDVRSWSEVEKDQLRGYQAQLVEENTPERVIADLTLRVLNNDSIEEISLTDSEVTIRHRTEIRLFGFIPLSVEAETTIDETGTEKTKYPWWSFLARKDTMPIKWMVPELLSILQDQENPLTVE